MPAAVKGVGSVPGARGGGGTGGGELSAGSERGGVDTTGRAEGTAGTRAHYGRAPTG